MKNFYFTRLKIHLTPKLNLRIILSMCFTMMLFFEVQANVSASSKSRYVSNNIEEANVEQATLRKLQQKISGVIIDAFGVPLPGATIIEKGTSNGAQSDFDGNFQIDLASKDAILVISYIGFVTQEIEVKGQTNLNISMVEDIANLDEVVVIGYGERTKKSIAGSIEQISGEILENRPVTNVLNGLQGAMPGLTVTRSSGTPGSEGYALNVRGLTSINGGNSPLVLIDGTEGDLNLLNPYDIESTTLLKDASASIYGARAAGGVLLITTKTGKKNKDIRFSYSSNYSTNVVSNLGRLYSSTEK